MIRRLSMLVGWGFGLWLWLAPLAIADTMSGGGVSSSGSQTWIGRHNNIPRCWGLTSGICDINGNLIPSGTVFTPPSSFGNWWIVNNAPGQTVACPPDMADGDGMNVHIQQGSGAPFSPALSFMPCYGWTSGPQPVWSSSPNQVDWAFCRSSFPADITGANFVCTGVLNVVGVSNQPPTYTINFTSVGAACGSAGVSSCDSQLMNVNTGDTLIVLPLLFAGGPNVNSVSRKSGTATVGSCTALTNANAVFSGKGIFNVYTCPVSVGGNVVMTANYSTSAATYTQVPMFSVSGVANSPDAGIGQVTSAFNGGPAGVNANGTTPQAGDFVLSYTVVNSGGATLTGSVGYTAIINNSSPGGNSLSYMIEYKVDPTLGDTPANSVAINQTQVWGSTVQILKHP